MTSALEGLRNWLEGRSVVSMDGMMMGESKDATDSSSVSRSRDSNGLKGGENRLIKLRMMVG